MNKQINWQQFETDFRPITNHLDDNASMGGLMFETFGEELDFVRDQPNTYIWTVFADYGNIDLMSGYHIVNRLGYIIAENPCNEYIAVINEDYDNEFIE